MSISFGQAIIGGLLFMLLIKIYKYIKCNISFGPVVRDHAVRDHAVRDQNADMYIRMKYNQEKQWRTDALDKNCDMDILSLFCNRQLCN